MIVSNLLYLALVTMFCVFGGGLGIVYAITDVERLLSVSLYLVYTETLREVLSLAPIGLLIGLKFGLIAGTIRALEIQCSIK